MKYIVSGLEGSGKSTWLALTGERLLYRNKRYFEKSGILRPVASNLRFSSLLEKGFSKFIEYWDDPQELLRKEHVDILWDEIPSHLDSSQWALLPIDFKAWLRQGRKAGIDIYATAQDFATIDVAFRRLTTKLWRAQKIISSPDISATRPVVKRPWGISVLRVVDRNCYGKEAFDYEYEGIMTSELQLITKHSCEIFDTTQKIPPGKYPPLRHIERVCADEDCTFHKVVHI